MGIVRWLMLWGFVAGWVLSGLDSGACAGDEPGKVDFNFDVRPILSDKCFSCHGPDARNRKGKLRLDTKAGLFSARPSGDPVVAPGDLDASVLIARVTSADPTERMPPPNFGRSLEPQEVERLKAWVKEGAPWAAHWSLLPPRDRVPPRVNRAGWARNPIDAWVLARLESEKLAPAARADRETLIRRVTLDLTGLPPALDEIDAFLADRAPGAYERVVDRLLASPRFGERMAVEWLDLARYADTHGYQADVYRPVWPWRDWVVSAWNHNMPFDRFITWQLAGDLLKDGPRARILATAFNRLHRQTNEGGSIEEEFRAEYVADRVNTFAATFLGMTLECARCHDHKYDPVSQKEYYQLFAFFNNVDESGLYSHFTSATPTPGLLLSTAAEEASIRALEREIAAASHALEALPARREAAFEAWGKLGETSGPRAPGPIGDFALDDLTNGLAVNRARADRPGRATDAPELVPGRVGRAIRLSGENNVTLPLGNFDRYEPFSIALWVKSPDRKDRAVVIHRSMASSDAGSRGYQLLIEDGKPSVGLIHFWPGNALAIRGLDPLPIGRWVHLAFRYDGSSRATGLELYVDGKRAAVEVVRDGLTKTIRGGGNDHLTIGQRFRDRGFKGGMVDEVKVYDRAISELEIHALAHPECEANPAQSAGDENRQQALRREFYFLAIDPEAAQARGRLLALRKRAAELVDAIPEIMVMRELGGRRPTYVLRRGVYDARGDRVDPGIPAALGGWRAEWPRNRLGLARWLTSPDHPLAARVVANRAWQSFFGRGIVATPEDFGSQGRLPSHPALLDWLARRLVDSGWDMKALARVIVTSATYRQDSRASAALLARDPENELLARGPRVRLSAEMLRDAALAASGELVEKLGGPPVKPYEPPGLWEEKSGSSYVPDKGAAAHRRSLYTFWKRTSPPPMMLAFDAVSREVCVVRRQPTSTPLQALVLLNDPQFVSAARGLAERALRDAPASAADSITLACRAAWGKCPDARERAILEALLREQTNLFAADPSGAGRLLAVDGAPIPANLDRTRLAAMTVLAQALLAHDAFVMKH